MATLDFRPAGLVPDAFYAGYGAPPPEPQASVSDLLMAAWRTRAELEGGGAWRGPPQAARLASLRELPSRLARLAGAPGVPSWARLTTLAQSRLGGIPTHAGAYRRPAQRHRHPPP